MPLSPNRRERGLRVLRETINYMGVNTIDNGQQTMDNAGAFGGGIRTAEQGNGNVSVNVGGLDIVINSNAGSDEIKRVIEDNLPEITNELVGYLTGVLVELIGNAPRKNIA